MNRRIVLVAAAVVLALFGTFAVYSYGKTADNRAVASGKATTVLVATKRVPAGTSWADAIKGKYLTEEKMPATSTPSSALAHTANAAIGTDAVAQADIAPGQIVLREAFGTKVAQTGVLTIPKGLLAITVSLPADADVAGFVAAGSQVIIFESAKLDTKDRRLQLSTGDNLTVIKTVLPRVGVIATSAAPPTNVAGAKNGVDSTATGGSVLVTLAVSQRDAERVLLAQKIGGLALGLLSASSQVSGSDPGVINAGVFNPVPIFVK